MKRSTMCLFSCATALAVSLAGGAAFACGAPFGNNVTVDPHQDIILVWKDGVETYVFQPTFCGTAADFGLILPVPAPLAQQPSLADQRAFTTAVALSEPTKHQVTEQNGVGCGASESAGVGAANVADEGPAVVASGHVGFLDWTQLKADSTSSLTDWLTSNGYPYSGPAAGVFAYYVQKGWYFIAFRISPGATSGTICQALGPVALSFPSPSPVIPSGMANAGGSSGPRFSWRIFGITHGDVQLSFPNATDQYHGLWYSGAISSADAASFAGLADAGDRLTRLILSFYASSTASDASLALAPAQDYRGKQDVVVYDDSACSFHANRHVPHAAFLSMVGLVMLALFCWRRRRRS